MKFSVKVDGLQKMIDGLKAQQDKMKSMNPMWRSIGEYMKKSITKHFDAAEAPDGTPWKPLSVVSPQRAKRDAQGRNSKRRGQRKPLNDTGTLRRSIQYQPSPHSVTIGTNLKYAPIHQFGGDIKVTPKMRAYLHSQGIHLRKSTNAIHIPARPFLGVNDKDLAVIREIMKRYMGIRN